jgi:hypothetical protein
MGKQGGQHSTNQQHLITHDSRREMNTLVNNVHWYQTCSLLSVRSGLPIWPPARGLNNIHKLTLTVPKLTSTQPPSALLGNHLHQIEQPLGGMKIFENVNSRRSTRFKPSAWLDA